MDSMNKEMTNHYDRQLAMKRKEDAEKLEMAYATLNRRQEESKLNQSQMMETWSKDVMRHYDQQLQGFRENNEKKLEATLQQLSEEQARASQRLQAKFQE